MRVGPPVPHVWISDAAHPGAAARSPSALPRLAAARARLLHGGALFRGSVPQQFAPHQKLLSVLGRIICYSLWDYRLDHMETTDAAAGEPVCIVVRGVYLT